MRIQSFVMLALFLTALVAPSAARAQSDVKITPQLSALMLDSRFDATLAQVRQIARAQKYDLRVTASTTLDIENQHWVYLGFDKRPTGSSTDWAPLGNIVGQYHLGANGNIQVESVFYEPAAEPPAAP